MTKPNDMLHILMADDDPDDRMLARKAFEENRLVNKLDFAVDGIDLMNFLKNEGKYEGSNNPLPGIILLDLNMPKMDGFQALKEIKRIERLKSIPVIVLATSEADEDIVKSYNLGVSSFISKPVSFDELVKVVRDLKNYWFKLVKLPR